jgi:ABC-2 type transport system ATP-binding protein
MQGPLLSIASVSRTLGKNRVLDHVSFDVGPGAVVGLLGPNGAGKTTLVRIIMGLTRPDEGCVDLRMPRTSGRVAIGYLPEERGLYQNARVDAVLTYLAQLKGLSRAESENQVDRWLTRVDLPTLRARRLEQLSKGQQQKVQLAAAFIGDPSLIVLDEPFAGLDPLNARLVVDLVREASAAGKGVLVSAHQLALVEQFCTEIVILARGRVAWRGTREDIPADRSLEDLFMSHATGGVQ